MLVPYFDIKINRNSFMYFMYGIDKVYSKFGIAENKYWLSLKYLDGLQKIYFKTINDRQSALNEIILWLSNQELEYVHIDRLYIYANPYTMGYVELHKLLKSNNIYEYKVSLAFLDADQETISTIFDNYNQALDYEVYLNSLIKEIGDNPIIDKFELIVNYDDDLEIVLGTLKTGVSCLDISVQVLSEFDGDSQFSIGTTGDVERYFGSDLVDLDYIDFYNHKHFEYFEHDTTIAIYISQAAVPTKGQLRLTIIPS
jgi:hypothetical protein